MSRPIFSPVATLGLSISSVRPSQVRYPRHHGLTPGQRVVDGRVFYSAAWLDQVTSTHLKPPALTPARKAGANEAPLPSGG
jgi:hypothetical protein